MTLLLSLVRLGAVLFAVSAVGWFLSAALFPSSARFRAERLGWSYAIGAGLIAAMVPLALLAHVRPGWAPFLVLTAILIAVSLRFRVRGAPENDAPEEVGRSNASVIALQAVIAVGIALYVLRALTEPMWSNDFIAIWGLKGKTIFGSGALPPLPQPAFSHPEYPLGLPLLYAGVAFLTGRWDDHAMALLFPAFQAATLLVGFGWLRRRGASREVALLAAAILACFEPLYSAFLTGMAEVPLSLGLLLFGTALADALDGEHAGALRRLALASALIAGTKNEGLFFAAAGCLIALAFGGPRRWKAALAALPTALLVHGLHLAWRGRLPLTDFEPGLFSTERVWDSLAAAVALLGWTTWAGLGLLLVLIVLGWRVPAGDRLLLLASCGLAAYLILPAFAVRGPAWLVQTTLLRTTAALAPLLAAAIAVRFARQERQDADG
jgi:hypothetical protein